LPNRPAIGLCPGLLTTDRERIRIPLPYSEALFAAGARPFILPVTERLDVVPDLLAGLRGVVLTGGPDLDPARYGQPPHPETRPADPRRTAFDLRVLECAEARGLPVLGICGGLQTINVARGGTLHQHLETGTVHRADRRAEEARHPVTVRAGTLLARIVGEGPVEVNSAHHQAADRVGRGLVVSARSPDGVIEALEDPSRPFYLAVQWHPERIFQRPEQLALFDALIRAAACS